MKILFTFEAWSDYLYWQENDLDVFSKINSLVKDTIRNPFIGLAKPEPLIGNLKGKWSRRINKEHRLVYSVQGKGKDQYVEIYACRFHYT